MRSFVHEPAPTRVIFGHGSLERVPTEVAALDLHRVLVIAGGSAASAGDRVVAGLGPRAAGRFDRVAQHVPEPLVADAVQAAKTAGADGLCSVGGGSATGLAKAVAVTLDLPIVAVPTTYAGSEATATYGITGERHKQTATDPRARVRAVVYDPALTLDLPARTAAASGFNALAHATAALTGPGHDPVAALYAAEAVRIIARALPAAVREPADAAARGELLWAAWLAGSALAAGLSGPRPSPPATPAGANGGGAAEATDSAATGAGLHHRLCHVLGGRHRLVHAEVHAVLLPHTVARDPALSPDGLAQLAEALGGGDAAPRLRALAATLELPDRLAAIGMPATDLDAAAEQAAGAVPASHPHHGDAAWFRALLDTAYQGGST